MKMNEQEDIYERTRAIALTFGAFTFNGALEDLAPTIGIVKSNLMPVMEQSTKIMSQYTNPVISEEDRRFD